MLNKKLLIILVVIVVVAALAAGVVFWWNQRQEEGKEMNQPGANTPGNGTGQQTLPADNTSVNNAVNNQTAPAVMADPVTQAKTDVVNLAKFFLEMIGSYSPDARLQNVVDLKPFMTNNMQAWADDFMKRNLATLDGVQESVVTRVLKSELINFSDSQVRVVLTARRAKNIKGVESNYSQEAEMTLVKGKNSWLVDKLVWK